MDLEDDVLRGVYSFGFTKPSKIQRLAIKPMMDRKDILGQSQSGTGKTGTFVIGAMNSIDPTIQSPQVLVISPVRELADQTAKVARGIGQYLKVSEHVTGLKVMTATGGTPVSEDLKALRGGAQFVVGTPGRIYDLLKRGMNLKHLKYLILDEADKLLEDLFADQIREILATGAFPDSASLAMFSATMPPDVIDIADKYLKDPVRILIPTEEVKLEGIKQFYIDCEKPEWKRDVLADLYQGMSISQAIIFANKKSTVEILANSMTKDGFTLEYIHGEMEPADRKKRMDDFRTGKVRILISTDVLARGIDVQAVSMVINYEMPTDREDYFHRIGRCGRYGRKGLSINLIGDADEMAKMKDIETHYSLIIPTLPQDLSSLTSEK
jgi:translation initiation factor 4A